MIRQAMTGSLLRATEAHDAALGSLNASFQQGRLPLLYQTMTLMHCGLCG